MSEAAMIGNVRDAGSGRVFLHTNGRWQKRVRGGAPWEPILPLHDESKKQQEPVIMNCCEGGHNVGDSATGIPSGVGAMEQKFKDFLQTSGAPGALDAKTKQSIAIALSVLSRCEPCIKIHIKKARAIGFSQEEIDEAAWMAISFGGSPTMVFYNAFRSCM
jgi:AhpD family alkylhydroperoxidase